MHLDLVSFNFCLKNQFYLGLGKNPDGTFRLWIDKDLNKNSYFVGKDEIYENGNILDPYINKFNVFFFLFYKIVMTLFFFEDYIYRGLGT